MQSTNLVRTGAALMALALFALPSFAQYTPGDDFHDDDLYLGKDQAFGTTGSGSALWFLDSPEHPQRLEQWLQTPHTLLPNISGPEGAGSLYFNLGSNVVTYYDADLSRNVNVLSAATFRASEVTQGLEIWKSQFLFFAGDPAKTRLSNTFSYPFLGTFHNHFAVRAFRPGSYRFQFRMTDVHARDGSPLEESKDYTLLFESRPVLSGVVDLTGSGWLHIDTTPDRTKNLARIYLFPAGSTPTRESDAIRTTDVFLDTDGSFQIPEKLIPDGPYRIGIKAITMRSLAVLYPGDVTLSVTEPPTLDPIVLTLGDVNRDGRIDRADLDIVTANQGRTVDDPDYTPGSDVNGDGIVDDADLALVTAAQGAVADFLP